MSLKIGWIGCGVMGRWMLSHCIDAGYPAFVYSRTASKCQPLIDKGAISCTSPAEVAAKSDVIFTIVGFPKDLEDVVFGNNGIFSAGLSKGKILVDMTTSRPDLAKRIASKAEELGCFSLDAPVSGGDVGAKEGRLAIMVGGASTAFNQVTPILKCMGNPDKGGKVELLGPPGSGQHTKLTNQILIASNMIGVVEALCYAQKSGLDVEKTLQIVSSGAAGSWSLSNLAPRMLKRNFEPGFFVEHFVKDMEIALDECKRMELSLPGLALSHQLYVALKAQGHAKKGTQGLLLVLEQLNGMKS